MTDKSSMQAHGRGSDITIVAGPGFQRTYRWRQCEIVAHPCPRDERWFGSLGIYDPAPGLMYWHFCEGISRPVVEEQQLHFRTSVDAETWLTRYVHNIPETTVYRNDGLVVQWSIMPERQQLYVEVAQLCINGQKPTTVPGAYDNAIIVASSTGGPASTRECTTVDEQVMDETRKAYEGQWGPAEDWRVFDAPKSARPE
jgi:hypothetical protein